ncbi:hypothetical protein PP655_gp106 [Bacillus phage PBC4]|nr:hypothetical protein PP655_gp106 [Bacillus phage PBC4]AKQ08298.1 hypothetical protein PBC4_106 [Bacillus phage PBC4]
MYLAWYSFIVMLITFVFSLTKDGVSSSVRLVTLVMFFPVVLFFGLYIFL